MDVVGTLQYTKLQQIGVGEGMNSQVYLAMDAQMAGQIAVKEILKSYFGNKIDLYFQEARTMFKVAHPNVVSVRYGCVTNDHVVLAMPYFSSGSMAKRISSGPLSVSALLKAAHEVLSGLAHIHSSGYVHLDIKPSNILFNDTGNALVADFGQSREITSSGTVSVPKMYFSVMPPETLNYAVATVHADVYQVGLMMYRACNGEAFYRSQREGKSDNKIQDEITKGKLPDRDKFLPHIPKRLKTVIRKALEIDPQHRYESATSMADALAGVNFALDWNVSFTSDGTLWRASREGAPDLKVELVQSESSRFDVQVFTIHNGKQRAKGKEMYWKESLSRSQANKHLKELFQELT